MIEIDVKTFKSGNSVAVRLPKELGVDEGQEFTVSKIGSRLQLTPKEDGRLSLKQLAERRRELGAIPGPRVGRLKPIPPVRKGF